MSVIRVVPLSLLLLTCSAWAQQEPPPCAELRAQIQQGTPANLELLATISQRPDCAFTSAEVYKAAYGDRPLPVHVRQAGPHRQGHDEDED